MVARGEVIRAKVISEVFRGEEDNMAAVAQGEMPARAYLRSEMPPPTRDEQLLSHVASDRELSGEDVP